MHNAIRAVLLALPLIAGAALAADVGTVTIVGAQREAAFTPQQLADMPHVQVKLKIRDVEHTYSGVVLADLLKQVGAPGGADLKGRALANALIVHSRDGYEVVLAQTEADNRYRPQPVILADHVDGKLIDENEGPLRLIVPSDIEPARSSKQVDRVTLKSLASPTAPAR